MKREQGPALMARHGAHALGIRRVEGEPVLAFYVESAPTEPVPAEIAATDDSGATVGVRTLVVVTPAAAFE